MKKTIYFFTTVTLCSLCIFSYPQILSAQDNTSEKTEVTFMVSGTGDYAKTQKEKLEQQLLPYFPDIEITVEAYPEEQYYTLLNTKLSMGEGPDFLIFSQILPDLMQYKSLPRQDILNRSMIWNLFKKLLLKIKNLSAAMDMYIP